MAGVRGLALRRSRAVVGGWLAVVVLCGVLGMAAGSSFHPTTVLAPGTESERWYDLTNAADFGANVNVLLSGPERELRSQGTALVEQLRAVPGVRVMSPFDAGRRADRVGSLRLRRGDSALFLADVPAEVDDEPAETLAPVRQAIRATVDAPVTSRITGVPAVGEGIIDEATAATHEAERIAIPLLILVLLLIFRSPVAAAIPLIMGLGTTIAAGGLVRTIATQLSLDQVAVTVTSMMALALGVDYSLLLVSRYREHRRVDAEAVDANVAMANRATSRTIAFAAVLLIAVMCAAALLAVGSTMASAAVGVATATVFGALSAIFVAPALLKELDPWLDRWEIPWRRRESRLARPQPILIPLLALIGLLLIAAPTMGLDTGTPDVNLLPKDAVARADYEEIAKTVGPGFGAVFNIVVQSQDERPLTSEDSLGAMSRLQRTLAADPELEAVLGPAQLNRVNRGVPAIEQALTGKAPGLVRLDRGLAQASEGSRSAGDGASALHAATGDAARGSTQLTEGIQSAEQGSTRLADGVGKASAGSERLARGSVQASDGASRLSENVAKAQRSSGSISRNAEVLRNDLQVGSDQLAALNAPVDAVESNLASAFRALEAMTTGRSDARFQEALQATRAASQALTGANPDTGEQIDPGYDGVAAGIDDADGQIGLGLYLSNRLARLGRQTQSGVGKLADGAQKLDDGVARLSAANGQLSDGLAQLAANGTRLPEGLGQLLAGSSRLGDGLGQVEEGAGRLSAGIGGTGSSGARQLTPALKRMHEGVENQRNGRQSGALERNSPELFDSGMLSLALVDGAQPEARERTQFVLDLSNSGRTAQITAFPTFDSSDPRLNSLRERIGAASHGIERPGLEVAVGGPAAMLEDYKDAATSRLPMTVAAFILISLLILAFALRAIPLAAICVALNLLTVGVTFGVMQLGFGTQDPLLGGPGYVDVLGLGLTLGVVFALSIDYQVFLLARIREEYRTTGSNDRALTAAIGSTAGVITGAATVMVAIFLAFCFSSYIGIRQMGVGLSVAVFLDATVVRLVLLPTAMRLAGDGVWWFPSWLDKRLPNVSL
jgi:RND superfamily putative drug exporter